ncbi:hypothetical protein [Micromonospora sp. ATCC 39149]|uniref:Uncharacterized protein n=1 Tax=Micromonospora carbonacea TaxID=47853 RepID=A0A7D6CCT7_9ACTN|nr:hypothetical protein [Micromonospora sp. ATCC 39149]QLJ96409.1 hypothetical protein HZU44_15655 [Micromonospora carbonacea]
MTDVSTALGVRLYPDLVELGGLASALALTATRCQTDVGRISAPERGRGRFTCAGLHCDRGTICVGLGSQARYFMIEISGADGCRADGDTTDLDQVVLLAGAWRGGASLGELRARFPFLDHVREPVGEGTTGA